MGCLASRLESLLDEGRLDVVLFALRVSGEGPVEPNVKDEVVGLLSTRFMAFAERAVERQQVSKLVEIIDLVAESREMALCRLQLLQWMGADLDAEGLLPESAKGWTSSERDEIMVLLLYQAGEIDAAIAQASKLENKQLLHSCRILSSRWDELTDDAMDVVKESEAGSEAFTQAWSRILIAADRSGNQELRCEAIENLSKNVFDESKKVRGIRWKSLAMHGQIEPALSILDQHRIYSSMEVSLASSRPERTFSLLGHRLELVDSKYAEWVDQALNQQKASQELQGLSNVVCAEVEKVVLLINCLSAVGRDDIAFIIAKRLLERWKVATSGTIPVSGIRGYLAARISPVIRKQWIEELVLFGNSNGDPKKFNSNDKSLLADSISDCDTRTLMLLLNAVKGLQETEPLRDQIAAACQIARGNTSAAVNVDQVLESIMANIYKRLDAIRSETKKPASFMDNLHRLLLKHGKHELADAYLRRFADEGGLMRCCGLLKPNCRPEVWRRRRSGSRKLRICLREGRQ